MTSWCEAPSTIRNSGQCDFDIRALISSNRIRSVRRSQKNSILNGAQS